MSWIYSIFYAVSHNFGAIVALYTMVIAAIAYRRGELGPFIHFLYDMLCGADGKPSSKNAGYFMGAAVLCWSYIKITLAIVRRIDSIKEFDPTWVFVVLLSVIAGLVGIVVLGSSAIQAKLQAKLQGPPDGPLQTIEKVETLTQEGPK